MNGGRYREGILPQLLELCLGSCIGPSEIIPEGDIALPCKFFRENYAIP